MLIVTGESKVKPASELLPRIASRSSAWPANAEPGVPRTHLGVSAISVMEVTASAGKYTVVGDP
jgi:hypothetical protein